MSKTKTTGKFVQIRDISASTIAFLQSPALRNPFKESLYRVMEL